ncbi:MAG: aldo/keto reductase [Clostridiales bacterium]|jgi:aryl-alcohol dehydrogenase-like predicted oxidoreductase|nr:aldo/keto reductase [Clostridiales bacterium]
MKYTKVAGIQVSGMSLGTVQLGMDYGIANAGGKPDLSQSFSMIAAALDGGVTSLDTARAYGDAEEVLGAFFKEYTGEKPFLTTKIPRFELESDAQIEKYIIDSVETSLEKLGVSKVNCVMLHHPANLYKHGDVTAKHMESLVRRRYTDLIGASVYTAEEVEQMLRYPVYTATQVPMSVFDQRMIVSGTLAALEQRGIATFVRSVFLQGLFFLEPDSLTDPLLLKYAKPQIQQLRAFAEDESLSIAQLAIAFIRDVPGVTSLVLGVDTKEQVKANLAYFDVPPIREKTRHLMETAFADVNIPEIMRVLSRPKS